MNSNKALYRFAAKAAGLFIVWQLGYYLWLAPHTTIESWVTKATAATSVTVLRSFGYEAGYHNHTRGNVFFSTISIHGEDQLNIGDPCNALTLVVLFADSLSLIRAMVGINWVSSLWEAWSFLVST